MSKLSKGITLTTILFIASVILTSLTIYHNYHNVFSSDGEYVHNKWPYFTMAIQLSLLTFFVGTAMGLLKKLNLLENKVNDTTRTEPLTILFWFGILGVLILLYYPGLNQLGLDSDSHGASAFSAISIIQTIFFYLILKQTLNEKISLQNYFLFLFAVIVIVFVSPFLFGGWE
ncbi:MAG: hypothetical protein FVQ77_15975 [Cytophagales bacterium]|nr:hypothetical protein [Cytophagales bacterium]